MLASEFGALVPKQISTVFAVNRYQFQTARATDRVISQMCDIDRLSQLCDNSGDEPCHRRKSCFLLMRTEMHPF